MQRSVPHATLVEIAGAGHMAPIERPDAVARALRAWLMKA
jgi:pimeloyl-ACP methyl ester carboxylesterase